MSIQIPWNIKGQIKNQFGEKGVEAVMLYEETLRDTIPIVGIRKTEIERLKEEHRLTKEFLNSWWRVENEHKTT